MGKFWDYLTTPTPGSHKDIKNKKAEAEAKMAMEVKAPVEKPVNEDIVYFAKYISFLYIRDYNQNISSVKLQKSLYFLFALYGEYQYEKTGEYVYLFDDCFEAFATGPVSQDIEREYYGIINDEVTIEIKPSAKIKFIEQNVGQILVLGDAELILLATEDIVWREAYHNLTQTIHLSQNKIIDEYVNAEYAAFDIVETESTPSSEQDEAVVSGVEFEIE